MRCSTDTWKYFAMQAGHLDHALLEVLRDPGHQLRADVLTMLAGVDNARLAETRLRPIFVALHGRRTGQEEDRCARISCLVEELGRDFDATRLRLLANHERRSRPAPYELSHLATLSIDEDHLVA